MNFLKKLKNLMKQEPIKLNVENVFNKNDKIILNNYKLTKPKDLTQITPQKLLEEREKTIEISQMIGGKKRQKKNIS